MLGAAVVRFSPELVIVAPATVDYVSGNTRKDEVAASDVVDALCAFSDGKNHQAELESLSPTRWIFGRMLTSVTKSTTT